MQEENLIRLLQKGDENSFRFVYDQNQKTVINICYRFVGDRETAEDLTQDVFIEVFRSVKHFRKDAKLSTWIYRIATSKSIDYIRSRKSKKRFAFLTSINDDEKIRNSLPAPGNLNPEKKLTDKETKEILFKTINSLPENQRIAFTLSKYDELSYKEIAEIMETTLASVESLIHRAKKNLEKKLFKYYKKII